MLERELLINLCMRRKITWQSSCCLLHEEIEVKSYAHGRKPKPAAARVKKEIAPAGNATFTRVRQLAVKMNQQASEQRKEDRDLCSRMQLAVEKKKARQCAARGNERDMCSCVQLAVQKPG
ncbi:hypothetical protein ACOSQ4_032982 [Xanthoceras sorbifolium]